MYFEEVHCTFRGTAFDTVLIRDARNIYGILNDSDEELMPEEDGSTEMSDNTPLSRDVSVRRILDDDARYGALYDYFDEAMEMFPPVEITGLNLVTETHRSGRGVGYTRQQAFSDYDRVDEQESGEIPEYLPQSGVDMSKVVMNPEFDLLSPDEARKKVEETLRNAQHLKNMVMSIPDEEIKLAQMRADLHLREARARIARAKMQPNYDPQAGTTDSLDFWLAKLDGLSTQMSDYSEVLSSKEVDSVIKHVERLILLFLELRETKSYTGMMAAILGYLQGMTERSLFGTIREYLADVISMSNAKMEPHAGVEGTIDEDRPEWLIAFRACTKDWKSVSKMPAWKYLQKILSLSVAAGLCKAADVNFKVGTMQLFSLKIDEKQASAVDLLDAILVTADYFVEAGYEAFKTGSVRPFYFDNQTARILDEAYVSLSASMKALPTGDLANTKYKTEQELAHVLENTLSGYVILRQQTKNPVERRTLEARCMKLEEWKLNFIQQSVCGGLREAPYSIYLVGKPGIGKSMMTQVLVEVVMQANGFNYVQKQVATINPGDKFASTVKNDTMVIIIDDFGNFVLEFETENPLKYIIEISNNVVSYVPKAEVTEKGKVAYRPKMMVVTSNMDNLLFDKLSNAPASAKRRGIRMKPRLKAEYAEHDRFSEDKYRKVYGDLPAICDAYDIDIQEWGISKWEYFNFEGKDTKNMSYPEALRFHIHKSQEHFAKQKDYVKNHGSIRDQIKICEHNCVRSTCAKCLKEANFEDLLDSDIDASLEKFETACAAALGTVEEDKMEPHFGVETVMSWFFRWMFMRVMNLFAPVVLSLSTQLKNSSLEQLQTLNDRMHFFSLFKWYDWLPDCVTESPIFEGYLVAANSYAIALRYSQLLFAWIFSFSLFLYGPLAGMNLVLWPYLMSCATKTHVRVIEEFRERRGALPMEFTRSRDKFLRYALAGAFLLTGLAAAYRLYSTTKVMSPQGNIAPTSMAEIRERDAEESMWARVVPEALPASKKSKCQTFEEASKNAKENLVYISYEKDGQTLFSNGFFRRSNVLYLPSHILSDEPTVYTMYRRGCDIKGARIQEKFSRKDAAIHPTKDLACIQISGTSPFSDLSEYFALGVVQNVPFRMYTKDKQGNVLESKGIANYEMTDNSVKRVMGYKYLLDNNTFAGMCMSVMVSETKAPMIVGFHIGGKAGTTKGCGVSVTNAEMQELEDQYFAKHIAALNHASQGEVYTQQYGIEWYESPEMHDKSPIHWLPNECNIRYFGQCRGRATYYSDVVSTPIAEKVKEVCGSTQDYAGPHFHRWKSWYESLVYSCQPAIGPESDYLDWAVADYEKQLFSVLTVEGVMDEVKKMSEIEIVSGKDGVKFLNAMIPNTSPGFPLTGAKSDLMVDLEPNEQHNRPRTFVPGVWEELRRFKACLLSGQRYHPLFKACLKDEATKLEKEKVRVFEAAPLVLQLAIREYFLPIARVMSLFPLISECAVGINAHGLEWDKLQEFIKLFGEDRIVAGDFMKYDLRMAAKLTSAAFKILIDFAEFCGYSPEDLKIMRGIASEVVYPMVAYNGDVFELQGGNPSGQNLTVYINSIVNSLLNRIGFRMIYPEYKGTFAEAVALATYGDDFKSSASKKFPKYNHISLAEKLALIDMKITMPNKTDDPVPFLTDATCDFLKRLNRLHECGYYLGALDEDSILKSLQAVVKSKHISIKEQCAQNIDGALREWFIHGREVYEKRRAQMKEIAEFADITHMCQTLNDTFDDKLKTWKQKYVPLEWQEEMEANATAVEDSVMIDDSADIPKPEVEIFEPHSGVECVAFTEINLERLVSIEHRCFENREFLWFENLAGPHVESYYQNNWIVVLFGLLVIMWCWISAQLTHWLMIRFFRWLERDRIAEMDAIIVENRRLLAQIELDEFVGEMSIRLYELIEDPSIILEWERRRFDRRRKELTEIYASLRGTDWWYLK